jgi:hypothetical protein
MARQGRRNPGREHLAGADVSEKMQRQYEHILQSLRDYHRFRSDAKRKQVAAATVRKMAENPGTLRRVLKHLGIGTDDDTRAELLSEEFHGRPARDIITVEQEEIYDDHGAVLGFLEELGILMEDGNSFIPIEFGYDNDRDAVLLVSNPAGTNLEFIAGDQNIDWHLVDGAAAQDKYLIYVGPVLYVAYFADKHHLSGPKSQAQGISYEHEFGEGGGELPDLVFDRRNTQLLLVGGEYTIEPEGITG